MSLIIFALLTFAASYSGSQFMPDSWHAALAKPSWNPPNWVFAPVWTVLYIMIAIAGWLASRSPARMPLVVIWLIALIFNGAWSWLFFGQHQIGLALIDIMLLWLSIVLFIAMSWTPARIASILFMPYLAWVSFAAALNFAIWQMNP